MSLNELQECAQTPQWGAWYKNLHRIEQYLGKTTLVLAIRESGPKSFQVFCSAAFSCLFIMGLFLHFEAPHTLWVLLKNEQRGNCPSCGCMTNYSAAVLFWVSPFFPSSEMSKWGGRDKEKRIWNLLDIRIEKRVAFLDTEEEFKGFGFCSDSNFLYDIGQLT